MTATAKSWLIANIGMIFTCIILVVCFICGRKCGYNEDQFIELIAYIVVGVLALEGLSKYSIGSIALLVLAVLAAGAMPEIDKSLFVPYLIALLCGCLVAAPILRFTRNHFDEVVSRRMRWKSSNVDMFDAKWKYTMNRFTVTLYYAMACAFLPYYILNH